MSQSSFTRENGPRPFQIPGCPAPGGPRFAYLNLRGHPRGETMLAALLDAGFRPEIVIDEESALAERGRDSQIGKLGKVPWWRPAPSAAQTCADRGIRYLTVRNHNANETRAALVESEVALAVLGDTRILKPGVIDAVPHGIVNVHPGLLPDVRGNNPYVWSIIHDLPQGVSAHLIDSGVDRGPILFARRKTLPAAVTLPELIFLVNEWCAGAVTDVLRSLADGSATVTTQDDHDGLTFREARPEIWALAAKILDERAEVPRLLHAATAETRSL